MFNKTNMDRIRELNEKAFNEAYVEEVKKALRDYYVTVQTPDDLRERLAKIEEKAFLILEA